MAWTTFETPLGPCGIAWSASGVTCVQLPEATPELTEEVLLRRTGDEGPRTAKPPAPIARAIRLVQKHLAGQPQDLASVAVDLGTTPDFPRRVYDILRQVPAGKTVSYGDLARDLAAPGASRAVGRAMATNPVPLLVPCHRVLAAGGKPGGFSAPGGTVTKARLLELEGASRTPSLFDAQRGRPLPFDRTVARDHLLGADSVLAKHIAAVGPFTLELKSTEGTFAALAESIVYQQLNGRAAATIFGRVRALFGKGVLDPRALLAMQEEDLRSAGLSANKLASLRDLSMRCVAGEIPTLPQLAALPDAEIVEKLTTVRGIGPWTVEMLLIFRLGRPDVLPLSDYGIKKGFARLFHRGSKREELPEAADLERRAERWRPYRSVASWYLWRAADGKLPTPAAKSG